MQRVDLVTLDPSTRQPLARGEVTDFRCARLHAALNSEIVCLSNNQKINGRFEFSAPYAAHYSRDLSKQLNSIEITPGARISRARISSDGTKQAWTMFVKGHNYMDAASSQFSTLTEINLGITDKSKDKSKDKSNEKPNLAHNLERWSLTHKGEVVKAIDLNYWGVTFHPKKPQQFLVTAFFKGQAYLALGDSSSKSMKVIFEGVECPSYSPEGDTIAFKKRMSSTRWAPAILNLNTLKSTVFSHIKQSVDDQIDWLDANTLIYEVVDVPLIGEASVDLMSLDISKPKQPHKIWLKNARSAAIYKPK
jgi:hypothetical protein